MECKNCQHPLHESDSFCNSCGAKVIRNRLTIRNLWGDFCEQFLNYDNRFLKTFLGMYTEPHVIISAYLTGTRKKYVNVLSYFAIALTFSGIQIFIIRKFFPEALDISVVMPSNVPTESTDINWVYDYLSIITMINLPIYGVIARLTFIGLKKFNYTEHLVIMTYIIAQFSITNTLVLTPLVAFFGLNFYVLGYSSNFIMMLYTTYCYKKLYPLSIGDTVLRVIIFLIVVVAMAIIMGIIQFIIGIMSAGGLEEFLMQVKAQQEAATSYIVSSAINWTS